MVLSYQRLLEIMKQLPDDDAKYVLYFILKNEKDWRERVEKLDKIQIDLHRKRVKAGDLVTKLKEHRRALLEAHGKKFYTGVSKLIEMLERVEANPELAIDNTPHWRILIDLLVKTKAVVAAMADSDKSEEELYEAQIPYEKAG